MDYFLNMIVNSLIFLIVLGAVIYGVYYFFVLTPSQRKYRKALRQSKRKYKQKNRIKETTRHMPDPMLASEVPLIRGVFSADFFEPSEILISQIIWLCCHVKACVKSFLESRIQHVDSKVLFAYIVD